MDLKIKDVADLLNVSEKTIRRWLTDGKIPAYRINQQYRFSRVEVEDWLINQKLGKAHEIDIAQKNEDSQDSHVLSTTRGNQQFSLYRALHKGTVMSDVPGHSKDEVIRTTMKMIAKDMNLDADVLTEMLLDRERMHPTALNKGIGIPHTRDFLLSSSHDVVTIVFPENSLEYGALDGKPVHTLFFLFACDDRHHLHLLSKIAHFCSQAATLEFLQSKPSKEELLKYIKTWESTIQEKKT